MCFILRSCKPTHSLSYLRPPLNHHCVPIASWQVPRTFSSTMAASEHGGINERAAKGFTNAANYDKYRPSYTPTATEELLKQCRVSGKKHAKILDLAAGSGKFTEVLAQRPEQYEIIAVEPHDVMRQVLEQKRLPKVTSKAGKADGIPLDDESVDAVICAQVGNNPLSFRPAAFELHIVHGKTAG